MKKLKKPIYSNKINQIKLGGISMADNELYNKHLASFRESGLSYEELLQLELDTRENLKKNPDDLDLRAMRDAAHDLAAELYKESTNIKVPSGPRKMSKLNTYMLNYIS